MDEKLYKELFIKRRYLKFKYTQNGRTPTICSDAALKELARLAPKNKEDLLNINGLGQAFVDKYGDEFMFVLNEYHSNRENSKNNDIQGTLQILEQRLVNISRKNKLLYMNKLSNKTAIDLFSNNSFNDDLQQLINGTKKELTLCNLSPKNPNLDDDTKKYKKLTTLYREIIKDYREHGDFNLYIGYPFVIGKTFIEDFNVRAPLCIIPVTLEKTSKYIKISRDETRDILYNNCLILLQNKINNKNIDLPNNIVDEITPDFLEKTLQYFKENGIVIDCKNSSELINFTEYTQDSFPYYTKGDFELVPNAVIGKFSMYETSIQRDYRTLIESDTVPNLVDNLLNEQQQTDFYLDAEDTPTMDNKLAVFPEDAINYINSLNASQENALIQIEKNDSLVIQGPPGTGKSQTITSIIADACIKDKNILMVSQKKAALDVIYSRLGGLSKYAVFIDNVNNKEAFYSQMLKMTLLDEPTRFSNNELEILNDSVNLSITELKQIKNGIFGNNEYFKNNLNTEMFKVYQENLNCRQEVNLLLFAKAIDKSLFKLSYNNLKNLHIKFSNPVLTQNCLDYIKLKNEFNWLNNINTEITTLEKLNLKNDLVDFNKEQELFNNKNFIYKLFKTSSRKTKFKKILKNYLTNTINIEKLYRNSEILLESLNYLDNFLNYKKIYDGLNNIEKLYINALRFLQNELKLNLTEVNNLLYNFIINTHITDYEIKNSNIIEGVENFNNIYNSINNNFSQKINLVKEKANRKLMSYYESFISSSKRYSEFKRQLESKRKISVSKFIDKYNFELLRGIRIWLMTPEAVSEIFPMESNLFDLLIFDEASQIYIEKAIPSIARSKKIVVSGDHKQLRPSSLGFGRITDINQEENTDEEQEVNSALEEESLLDLTRFKYKEVLLNYHYRAKYEELISFSNYAFYKGRLNVSPNTLTPERPPIEVVKIDNGLWDNRTNLNEALKVVELIKNHFSSKDQTDTLGIITFNVSQRDLILDLLDEECQKDSKFATKYLSECERKDNGEDIGFFVKNIENVQGDERDCIIFSLAYAKNSEGKVIHNFGWLNQIGGENRLNVAISRAKKKVFIVTSIIPEDLSVDKLENDGPKIFKKYLQYANAISSKNNDLAKTILLSFVNEECENDQIQIDMSNYHNEIINEIAKLGYSYELNVGIGAYKINVAIKDKNNNYILGIDFDDNLYNKFKNTRERDIHRQKYLETRGWKIFRLWTPNWWKNKESELNKIKQLLKDYSEY